MSQRQERIDRIVAVEREYLAASVAADGLQERLGADPTFLGAHELRSRDAHNLRSHLEGTYVIRLCAEFEAGLRDAWQNAFGHPTQPPLRDRLVAATEGFLAWPDSSCSGDARMRKPQEGQADFQKGPEGSGLSVCTGGVGF